MQLIKSKFTLIWLAVFFICSCAVTWVSEYDEQTDKSVTQLHRSFETFFTELDNSAIPKCLASYHQDFYSQAMVEVRSISVRAKALANNSITVKQLALLESNIGLMQKSHQKQDTKGKCMGSGLIQVNRSSFETTFTAILKFELAKKRPPAKS